MSASSAGTAVPPRAQQAAAVFVLFFNFQLILIPQFHASTFCLQPPDPVTNNPWLETKLEFSHSRYMSNVHVAVDNVQVYLIYKVLQNVW